MLLSVLLTLPALAAAHSSWYQPRDSPVHDLFKRQNNGTKPDWKTNADGWRATYPEQWKVPPVETIPKEWTDKLNSIKLPEGCPVANKKGGSSITYPDNKDGNSPEICSFTYGCHNEQDVFAGPDGVFVLTFDDGPTEASPKLYDFLKQNNITKAATHFYIGGQVIALPQSARDAFDNGGHLAVHTWSHQMTSTLSNEQVVAELGWTMQAIYDVTGRLPLFWRPPYGDTDNRVRAIAKEVFGMIPVLWNKDTNDWQIGEKQDHTVDSVTNEMKGWFHEDKNPGIVALEHELNDQTVQVFLNVYPEASQTGWKFLSVADAFGFNWYQNSKTNADEVFDKNLKVGQPGTILYQNQTTSTAAPQPSGSANATTGANNGTAHHNSSSSNGGAVNNANGTQPSAKPSADGKSAAGALTASVAGVAVAAVAAALSM
ncbi:Chitin deacetylase [Trichosporon asahii var. asahii CBS 2479]|uniref:chitin deacetylase n=1 Tax=Trichosporon asahii var. asahii (strain ATCC 90039 / CBS 2479 / JCM 2466 / KCTC 7840 / NBRC 103889/ NCYC 2677 / UAMH 7654) TaxID=1186058 RepID=J5T396_TRIAS|nr:Chitin deacetylase [Trichosporon asahii var. asahii CBS 2479]EJT48936.1 Chitin deacetylase [Trichosporon asahii var. asahii CBS 2479]